MPWFIKTETFTSEAKNLAHKERCHYLSKHKEWVKEMNSCGIKILSGYLVDINRNPGGGGLMLLQAESLDKARHIISQDPMIKYNIVDWRIQEWIPISENLEII